MRDSHTHTHLRKEVDRLTNRKGQFTSGETQVRITLLRSTRRVQPRSCRDVGHLDAWVTLDRRRATMRIAE